MRHLSWDESKRRRNIELHGYDFVEAYEFPWGDANVSNTYPSATGTQRFLATGELRGRFVTIIFSTLGTEGFSIISMRPASKRERQQYESSR